MTRDQKKKNRKTANGREAVRLYRLYTGRNPEYG